MTRHLAIGPQVLATDSSEPMTRYHVEEKRGILELRCDCPNDGLATLQWYQHETAIPGATSPDLILGELSAADADVYFAQWKDSNQQLHRSQSCLVVVVPGLTLTDQSTRAIVTPEQPMIFGFVIGRSSESTANQHYLLRVLGPSLKKFEVNNGLADAKVSLFRRGNACDHLLQHDPEFIAKWSPRVGAFALADDSKEFVAKAELPAGHYTLHVESTTGLSGQVLVEIYQTSA
ncbi:immunoglobulin domain-containing protein [bacterium]|nr:immunoglobulin domain-containing protein [bacterium]